ncbi:MAG: polysaccharide deacetylase family protein, partial [Solirubrobacterales bacterium]
LAVVALVSLAAGVALGASHRSGGGGSNEPSLASAGGKGGSGGRPRLRPGGLGAPPDTGKLVRTQASVPVLMYHVIADPPSTAQLPELYVDPKTFDRQLEALEKRGYTGVSLNQVYDAWFKDGELPEKPVVVSFDDGYRSQYVYARPELRKLGWPGVLSAIAGRIGRSGAELSNAMVENLIDNGWELDSHTINHVDVSQASGAQLQDEIAGSRRILRRRFHQPVNFFCYPSGRYDAQAEQAVRAAGYLGATTTDEGLASKSEMYTLKRIRVNGSDGVGGLERKLEQAGA